MTVIFLDTQSDGVVRRYFRCPGCNSSHFVNDGWTWNGSVEKPTFSPSILVQGVKKAFGPPFDPTPTVCHSYVVEGRIQYLGDSTHALAGQVVDLPPWKTPSDTSEVP